MGVLDRIAFGLLCGSALPSLAVAQNGGEQPSAAGAVGSTTLARAATTGDAAPAAPASVDAGDIVVTAQRRSERLRDVPISITALSQDTLVKSGVTNTIDLQRVTPGLQLPLYGGFLQPAIRGISSAGAGLGDQSNVAIYVDGIYQPSEAGQLLDLPDVQQVEVLKGPQGTLYGQNAAGGAIIVTTVAPSFDTSGRLSASYGNYDDKAFRGYVTGPIVTDKIAGSIAASYENHDGWRHDVVNGGHDRGLDSTVLRGKLLVQPTDNLSLTAGTYYTHRTDYNTVDGQPVGPGTPLGYALAAAYGVAIPKASDPQETALSFGAHNRTTTYGFNLLGKLDTDLGTISTVTAYGNVKVRNRADIDFTAADLGGAEVDINHHNFIQELNFTSRKTSRLTVSAGLFYLALRESYVPNSFAGGFLAFGDPLTIAASPAPLFTTTEYGFNRKRDYAAYAEAGYDLTDTLNVTVAGRYTYETQRTADNHLVGTALLPDPRGTVHFQRFTPRATLRYAIDGRSNIYASYSQGFKSGYVNAGDSPVAPLTTPVQPEKVFAYEVGYKGRPLPGVTFNIAAFYYDYKDLQVYTYTPPTEFYRNAATAHIKGIDGDVAITLLRGLNLTLGAAYLDAHYVRFPNAVVYEPDAAGFGYDVMAQDVSGHRLPRAPKLSGNAALDYVVDTARGRFGAHISGTYNSGITYDSAGVVRQGRYATMDAEVSFAPSAVRGLRLVLWGKNLTDHDYLSSVLEDQFALGGTYSPPRTFGGRAEFAF